MCVERNINNKWGTKYSEYSHANCKYALKHSKTIREQGWFMGWWFFTYYITSYRYDLESGNGKSGPHPTQLCFTRGVYTFGSAPHVDRDYLLCKYDEKQPVAYSGCTKENENIGDKSRFYKAGQFILQRTIKFKTVSIQRQDWLQCIFFGFWVAWHSKFNLFGKVNNNLVSGQLFLKLCMFMHLIVILIIITTVLPE